MATIVWHRKRQTRYILLGAGFGVFKTAMPGVIGGMMLPEREAGQLTYALVSDENCEVSWVEHRRP